MMFVRITTVVVVVLVLLVSSLTQAQRAQRENNNNKACDKGEECVKKTDCGKNINIIRFCDDNNNNMVCCPSNNRKQTSAGFNKDNKSVKSKGKNRLKALENEERKEKRKEAKENRNERNEKMRKGNRRMKNRNEDDKEMRKGKERKERMKNTDEDDKEMRKGKERRRQKTKKNRNESDKKLGKRKKKKSRKGAKENRDGGDQKIGKGKRRKVKNGLGKGKEKEIRNEKNKERRNQKFGKTRKGAAKNKKMSKGSKKMSKGNKKKMITERKQKKNAKDRKKEERMRKRGKKKMKSTKGKMTLRKGGEEGEEENPQQKDLEDNDAKLAISHPTCGGKCGKKKTRGICTPENKCKRGTFVLNPECASVVKSYGGPPCGCCIIHKPVICKTRGKCRKKGGMCKEICDDGQVVGSKCGKGCVCCHDANKCELTTKCKKKKGKCVSKDECDTKKKKFKTKLCKSDSNSGDCGCCFKKKKKKDSWERPIKNGCIVKGKKPCKCCAPECIISPECEKWGGFCVSDTDDILWKCMAPNYTIGDLKFLELRTRAMAEMGASYDIKQFHEVVLESVGPLDLVEDEVEAWINSVCLAMGTILFTNLTVCVSVLTLCVVLVPGSASDAKLSPELQQLVDDYFNWRVQDMPQFATFVGIHDYDDLLDDMSLPAYQSRYNKSQEFLVEAEALEPNLSLHSDLTNLRVLKDELLTYIEGYPFQGFLVPLNYMEGPHVDLTHIISWMVFETPQDYEKLLSRYGRLPEQLVQIQALMEEGEAVGFLNHAISMNSVVAGLDGFVVSVAEDSPLWSPLTTFPENFTQEQITDFQTRGAAIITGQVAPAFQQLRDYVSTYTTRPDIAITSLPNGAAIYRQLLRFHTSTSLTPEEIHQTGLDEVTRIEGEMAKIVSELGYNMTVPEFSAMIKNDSTFYYDNADDLLAGFQDLVYNVITPQVPLVFTNIPQAELSVVSDPSPGGTGAFYLSGSFDGSRPGVFYVNTYHYDESPKYQMRTLSMHEGNPGHHLQGSHSIESSNMPYFRRVTDDRNYYQAPSRFPMFTAFIEGWGLYAESLGYEMSLYDDPYDR
ncbi:hypothetical protein Pmani_013714 [Petrolisthes manimaculis]|uniref:Uncharacterized protein n=1 Tax=Petrolisthes manimaculis TaxID=1843537 RepID=A0AAE1PV32_9EUCA|nr:hypothetical protein Pmani_013714 [Petrolisthes manimaculis]